MPSRSAICRDELRGLVAVAGVEHGRAVDGAHRAMSSSAICDGPSSPIETPACEPERQSVARLIAAIRMKSYAREWKAANEDANTRQPPRLEPDGGRGHLLLGDVHLEVPVRMRVRKISAKVEFETSPSTATTSPRAGSRPPPGPRRTPCASPPRRRARTAAARARPSRIECGSPGSGFATSTPMLRSPPSSAIAASGSSSGLPCQPVLVLDRLHALALDRPRDDRASAGPSVAAASR